MNESPVILHVDDDESCLELSRYSFERMLPDVEVVTRSDADEALATLSVESVDAVVSDSITLADGTPFVEAARNTYPDLPIVLYTGREFTDAAPYLARSGVTEYVQKRADTTMEDLLTRVERLVDESTSRTDTDRFRYDPDESDTTSPAEPNRLDLSVDLNGEWTELARCDPTSTDDLLVTLVEALGERADDRPLVELFDAEALARVFSSRDDDVPIQLRIQLDTHEIVVKGTGLVASRPVTSA